MSTFPGILEEYDLISIDRFEKENYSSTLFFLSHCHEDHMKGLSSSKFCDILRQRKFSKIYLSELSKMLLINDDKYSHLSEYLESISLEQPTMIPVLNANKSEEYNIVVTSLPAGHCPGSVMFFIEGPKGNILYTGDFRIEKGGFHRLPHLCFSNKKVKPIETLYLDTTFCDPKSLYFPSREQSVEAIISLIKPWISKGTDHVVYVECPAKYGYENIFMEIYDILHIKVHVSQVKYKKYKNIEALEKCVTVDSCSTQIHACYKSNFNCIEQGRTPCNYSTIDEKTVKLRLIKPCAMTFAHNVDVSDVIVYSSHSKMYRVCYPTHSSLTELWDLINFIKPKKIYANVIPKEKSMEQILEYLNPFLNNTVSEPEEEYRLPLLGTLKFAGLSSTGTSNWSLDFSPISNINLSQEKDPDVLNAIPEINGSITVSSDSENEVTENEKESSSEIDLDSSDEDVLIVSQNSTEKVSVPVWKYSPPPTPDLPDLPLPQSTSSSDSYITPQEGNGIVDNLNSPVQSLLSSGSDDNLITSKSDYFQTATISSSSDSSKKTSWTTLCDSIVSTNVSSVGNCLDNLVNNDSNLTNSFETSERTSISQEFESGKDNSLKTSLNYDEWSTQMALSEHFSSDERHLNEAVQLVNNNSSFVNNLRTCDRTSISQKSISIEDDLPTEVLNDFSKSQLSLTNSDITMRGTLNDSEIISSAERHLDTVVHLVNDNFNITNFSKENSSQRLPSNDDCESSNFPKCSSVEFVCSKRQKTSDEPELIIISSDSENEIPPSPQKVTKLPVLFRNKK